MTDAQFAALTSVFCIGGLVGSAGANVVMDSRGRRGALRISAVLTTLGALSMTIAPGYVLLFIGRCVPPILQTITRPNQLPQIVGRHCCRRWKLPDPNLHRRSIPSEDSRQSWSVDFAKTQITVPIHIWSQGFLPNSLSWLGS